MNYRSLWVAALCATALLACRKEPEEISRSERPKATAVSVVPAAAQAATPAAPPNPSALHGMPGALGVESEEMAVTVPVPGVKSTGTVGDRLEGDVYLFKMLSSTPCGAALDAKAEAEPAAPAGKSVVGVKVRIDAKSRLGISPRDVTLHRGGVTFYASVSPDRRLKGCTPLLKVSSLRKKESIEGFVLFDLPSPDLKGLELEYRPTRWGGAGQVRVALDGR